MTVVADGGHGALGSNGTVNNAGGTGAMVIARVPVTPGATLGVNVGGTGTTANGTVGAVGGAGSGSGRRRDRPW